MNARRETRSAPMTYRNALRLDRPEVVDGAPIGADIDLYNAARAKQEPDSFHAEVESYQGDACECPLKKGQYLEVKSVVSRY